MAQLESTPATTAPLRGAGRRTIDQPASRAPETVREPTGGPTRGPVRAVTPAVFTLTAFLGAGLLFVVQPMVAKLLLPAYGGSATVWSTSSLFFQVLLLGAYWYAHASTNAWGPRLQPRLHLPLLLLPLLALPVALPAQAAPASDTSPVLWLLRTLVLMIGLPFAVVATTGPLLQRWYSWTDHRRSSDPYFLFAAGNLGSFGGLLAYPLVIEPHVSLATQRTLWTWGFVGFAVLCGASAMIAGAHGRRSFRHRPLPPTRGRLDRRKVVRWTLLAFLPSSMMLAVTAHLSTDVAAIPLLWVVPLAVYLATFVVAFARGSRTQPVWATRIAIAMALVAVLTSTTSTMLPTSALVAVNLALLAAVAYAAHARLAADRPDPAQLTGYFLVISAGGALGGLVNGVIAPVLLDRVLEYPLALLAVPLLMLGMTAAPGGWLPRQVRVSRVRAAIVALAVAALALAMLEALQRARGLPVVVALVLVAVLGLGVWVSVLPRAVLVACLIVYVGLAVAGPSETLTRARSFYGSYEVTLQDGQHLLSHGTTRHGSQFVDEADRARPTTYYSPTGPLGDVFGLRGADAFDRVAVVGLGAGTIAAYGRPGQTMTFIEIDQGIVDLARDPRLFTYLRDSDAEVRTVVGDGRLRLEERAPGSFDLLVLDAFSSDSIPIHLLTQEAFEVYRDRLTPDGVLLVHISNRVFDLEPVVAGANSRLGWAAAVGHGGGDAPGGSSSVWVALSPDVAVVDTLLGAPGWRRLDAARQVRWTDDYSSILSVLK